MPASRTAPQSVDEYIAAFPPDVQKVLARIRQVVRRAAPGAREVISYGVPTLRQNGILVHFAAFKHHIGLYPPIRGDSRLEKAAARYANEKGNLRFPLDQPIPYELIGALTELRATQDRAEVRSRTKKG
jgi:uncharacterized protein YdhG (YjbR/CyaY superfamily)